MVSDGVDTATASTSVTVANLVPVAHAGGPYTTFRNAPVVLDGAASADRNGDPLTYAWDFGDGATGRGDPPRAPGATPTHTYTTFGTFVVRLIVNDGYADSAPALAQVTVPDRRPVANAGGPVLRCPRRGHHVQRLGLGGSGRESAHLPVELRRRHDGHGREPDPRLHDGAGRSSPASW